MDTFIFNIVIIILIIDVIIIYIDIQLMIPVTSNIIMGIDFVDFSDYFCLIE
jgi:hypothetical protein